MMKFPMYLAGLVGVSAFTVTPELATQFGDFMNKYQKSYDGAEYLKRIEVFSANLDKAAADNKQNILKGGEAVFGVTKFSDLSSEEFQATYLNYKSIAHTRPTVTPNATEPLAGNVDWRNKNAVTPVKDQGQCGSCWAFSTTEAIESYSFLAGNKLTALSPQQINACDQTDMGCNGGNTETAYAYVVQAGGIETERDYPYTSGGGNTGTCKFEKSKIHTTITGYNPVTAGEKHLKTALNSGPVSVCLAATAFQSYTGGILKHCDNNVDHCVQAVGYNDKENYWLVRNSWAVDWGEQGYIRIEQGKDLCKISDDVTYPTFK